MHGSTFPFIPELFSITSMAERRADAASPRPGDGPKGKSTAPKVLPAAHGVYTLLLSSTMWRATRNYTHTMVQHYWDGLKITWRGRSHP